MPRELPYTGICLSVIGFSAALQIESLINDRPDINNLTQQVDARMSTICPSVENSITNGSISSFGSFDRPASMNMIDCQAKKVIIEKELGLDRRRSIQEYKGIVSSYLLMLSLLTLTLDRASKKRAKI